VLDLAIVIEGSGTTSDTCTSFSMGTRRTLARTREMALGFPFPFGAKFLARAVRQHLLISLARRPLFGLGNPGFA